MMEVVLTVRIPDCWITEVAGLSDRPIMFLRSVPDGREGGEDYRSGSPRRSRKDRVAVGP